MDIKISSKFTSCSHKFIQSEHNQTTVKFDLPASWDGKDLTKLDWAVRCTNLDNHAFYSDLLLPDGEGDRLILPWSVTRNYTSQGGKLLVLLVGTSGDALVAKLAVEGMSVDWTNEGRAAPQADYFEELLAKLTALTLQAQQWAISSASSAAEAASYTEQAGNVIHEGLAQIDALLKSGAKDNQLVLQQGIQQINTILQQGMIITDPTTGNPSPVQTVVYNLFALHITGAITPEEFDALGLTSEEFDAFEIDPLDFDTNAKNILKKGE